MGVVGIRWTSGGYCLCACVYRCVCGCACGCERVCVQRLGTGEEVGVDQQAVFCQALDQVPKPFRVQHLAFEGAVPCTKTANGGRRAVGVRGWRAWLAWVIGAGDWQLRG